MDGPEMHFLRQTMLQQECIFKEQVRELHRLYERQKLLMTEVKRDMLNSSSYHPPTPGTRDFLNPLSRQEVLTRKSSPVVGGECTSFSRDNSRAIRRRTLDLEQLPDDNDHDIEYVLENSQQPGTSEKREPPQAISFSLNKTWEENCTLDSAEPSSSRQHGVEAASEPPRPTLEEMALFPIPSTADGEPVKDQPKPLFESERGKNGILGWQGSGKKCDQEAYWGQQVAQLPHWLLQSCRGPPDKRAQIPGTSQGYDFTKRDPWKTHPSKECHAIGQQASEGVHAFSRSMPEYEQHGRRFSHGSSANYPSLNMSEIACLQMNSLGQTVLVPADVNRGMLWSQPKNDHAWLRQAPLAYSYFTQEASTPSVTVRKNGFVVDASRIYADSLRSSWYSGNSLKPPVPTFDNKENPPKFFYDGCSSGAGAVTDKQKHSSNGSAAPRRDAETGVGFTQVDEQYGSSSPQVEDAKSIPMEASLTQLVCQEETWNVGGSAGSVPAIADGSANVQIGTLGPSCTDSSRNIADISTDSAVVNLEVIRVDGFSASTGGSRATECIGDSDCMGVNDTASAATILLSFAPEKSSTVKASNGKAVQESSLLSDVKLFKSVAIMLKGGGAKTSKKLVATKAFRRGEAAAAGKGLLRSLNSGVDHIHMRQETRKSARRDSSVHSDGNKSSKDDGASKKGAQSYTQSWIWGDVTRRKRMQRQRHHAFRQPQQVQV